MSHSSPCICPLNVSFESDFVSSSVNKCIGLPDRRYKMYAGRVWDRYKRQYTVALRGIYTAHFYIILTELN